MRKYIHIAKMMKPELTDEAEKAISDEYAELRSREDDPKNARVIDYLIICLNKIQKTLKTSIE